MLSLRSNATELLWSDIAEPSRDRSEFRLVESALVDSISDARLEPAEFRLSEADERLDSELVMVETADPIASMLDESGSSEEEAC